jgi:hypothetical protein
MTIGYITIGALDVGTALPFYDAVLGPMGYARGPIEGAWAFFYGKPGLATARRARRAIGWRTRPAASMGPTSAMRPATSSASAPASEAEPMGPNGKV